MGAHPGNLLSEKMVHLITHSGLKRSYFWQPGPKPVSPEVSLSLMGLTLGESKLQAADPKCTHLDIPVKSIEFDTK